MSTSGDTMMNVGESNEYIKGCSVHRDFRYKFNCFKMTFPHIHLDIVVLKILVC